MSPLYDVEEHGPWGHYVKRRELCVTSFLKSMRNFGQKVYQLWLDRITYFWNLNELGLAGPIPLTLEKC